MSRKVRSRVKVLSVEELRKLPTPRLRAYVQRLHKVHETPSYDDPRKEAWRGTMTKLDPEWQALRIAAFTELKSRPREG